MTNADLFKWLIENFRYEEETLERAVVRHKYHIPSLAWEYIREWIGCPDFDETYWKEILELESCNPREDRTAFIEWYSDDKNRIV